MRLDDAGFEASGLLDLRLSLTGPSQGEQRQPIKIAELGGFWISLNCRVERLGSAVELLVACVPAAELHGVVGGGMRLEPGDQGGRSIARRVR